MSEISARTLVELKEKARRAMGWRDARTWTSQEHDLFRAAYNVRVDFDRGRIVAEPKQPPDGMVKAPMSPHCSAGGPVSTRRSKSNDR